MTKAWRDEIDRRNAVSAVEKYKRGYGSRSEAQSAIDYIKNDRSHHYSYSFTDNLEKRLNESGKSHRSYEKFHRSKGEISYQLGEIDDCNILNFTKTSIKYKFKGKELAIKTEYREYLKSLKEQK